MTKEKLKIKPVMNQGGKHLMLITKIINFFENNNIIKYDISYNPKPEKLIIEVRL